MKNILTAAEKFLPHNPYKFRHTKLLRQFFFYNFMLSFVVLIITCVFAFNMSSDSFKNSYIHSNESKLAQRASFLDATFSTASKLRSFLDVSIIAANKPINFQTGEKNIYDFHIWLKQLNAQLAEYEYIDNVWIYKGNVVIDSSTTAYRTEEFDSWPILSAYLDDAKRSFEYMIPYITNSALKTQDNSEMLSVLFPISPTDRNFSDGCIVVNLKIPALIRQVRAELDSAREDIILYDTNRMRSYFHSSEEMKSISLSAKVISESNLPRKLHINGRSYYLHSLPSKTNPDFMYLFLSDYRIFTDNIHSMRNSFILAVIVLLVAELILSFLLARHVYTPLENITSNMMRFMTDDSKDEIAMLDSYIQNTNSSLQRLDSFYSDMMPNILENLFIRMVQGASSCELVLQKLSCCGIVFDRRQTVLLMVIIDDFMNAAPSCELSEELQTTLYKSIAPSFPEDWRLFGGFTDKNTLSVAVNTDLFLPQELSSVHESLNSRLAPLGLSVSLCYSHTFKDIKELKDFFPTAVRFSMEHFLWSNSSLHEITQPAENISAVCAAYTKSEGEICSALAQNLPVSAAQAFDKSMSHAVCYAGVRRLTELLFKTLTELKAQSSSYFLLHEYQSRADILLRYGNIDCFKELIIELFEGFAQSYTPSNPDETIGTRLKHYLEQNYYQKDLSLTMVSEEFKLSPTYLSSMFKNANGQGVLEYLNHVRIDHAKALLTETDIPISEISDRTGFSNYTTFSRVFKRITGISAKDYRSKRI